MFTIDVRDMGLRARTMVAHLIFFFGMKRGPIPIQYFQSAKHINNEKVQLKNINGPFKMKNQR